jgi:hypothetical protein
MNGGGGGKGRDNATGIGGPGGSSGGFSADGWSAGVSTTWSTATASAGPTGSGIGGNGGASGTSGSVGTIPGGGGGGSGENAAGGNGANGRVYVTVTSFTSSNVTTSCEGASTTLTITGNGFQSASGYVIVTDVKFGSTSATPTVTSATSLTVTVPASLAAGNYTITLLNGSTTMATSSANYFTINPLPTSVTVSGAGTFCGSTTITASNGGSGTIYFQGITSDGTSTSTASSSQSISASGTYYFRAQSAAGCWGTAGSATVTVNTSPSITGQPADQSVTTAQTATFTVTATGTATLSYQWQEYNGTSWSNLTNTGIYTGTSTATLTITSPSTSLNGYKYRCTVSNSCTPSATSDGNATLFIYDVNNIPATGTSSITTCQSYLYDSGGSGGNYALNSSGSITINPSSVGNVVSVSGTVTVEAGYDYLTIYDGSSTSGTVLWGGAPHGTGTACTAFNVPVTTSTTGPLTIKFTSDASTVCTGVNLTVTCVTLPACSGTPSLGDIQMSSTYSCSSLSVSSTLSYTQTLSGLTYQWQESTDNSTFTDISGQTDPLSCVITLTSADKYYRIKATCSNGGGVGYSNSQIIYYDCSSYCTVSGSASAYGHLASVNLTGITASNISRSSTFNGYVKSTQNATLLAGSTYTISGTINNSSTTGRYLYGWIDYDGNGTFTNDASERIIAITSTTSGAAVSFSQSFTVPANAACGSTRLRLVWKYGSGTTAPIPCDTYNTYIDWEDYGIIICANPTISSPTADATVTKCSGENTSFSVTATTPTGGGSTTYQWQVNTGSGYSNLSNAGVYSGVTTSTITLTGVTAAMNGYLYRCIVSSSCGGSATSFVTTLNVGAAPTASAGGSATICANSTATVADASATNGTIAWTENGGGSITANSTLENPTYTPLNSNESNVVTLTMTVTGTQTGCTSTTASATYTVTVNPNPAITLTSSNPSVCQGSSSASITYSGISNSGNQFSINYDGTAETAGFVDVTDASTTSSPISMVVPVAAATGTYNGSLTVRSSSTGCSSASSYPITVTVNKVDVTMSANPQVCQGITSANVAFTIVEGTPNEYTIDFDATANGAGFTDITSYTNFSSSPIAVTVPGGAAVGTYNGTITFRNSTTGCTEANSFAVVVTESPQVSNFALSSSAVCAGFGNTITVTSSSLATGTYTVTYNVSGANTANGLTSTLNFTAGSPGTGTFTTGTMGSTGSTTLTVTQLTSGCSSNVSSGNTTTYTVNASPATPTASNSGAGTGGAVCEGSALTLSATGSSGTYTWSGPNSYATTGATPTVSSTATTAMAGTYSVYATDNGCQSQTATTTVTVNTVGITLGSNPSVCAGTTSANLTYSAVNGSPSQYSIDYNSTANTAGFSDVSLATLSSSPIVLTVPSNPGAATYSGTLTVKNTTNGCTSNTSYPISVTVNALPTITIGSSPTVCRGASSANLTYSAQSGANQYAIDFDATAEGLGFTDVALTSLSASPVAVTIPTGASNGTYNSNLTVRNTSTGCVSNNYAWTVTLTSPTVTATASPDAFCTGGGTSTITAAGANTYSWSTGASTSSISPNVSSTTTYTVTGTRTSDGCTAQATATVSVGAGTTIFTENFESSTVGAVPTGWTVTGNIDCGNNCFSNWWDVRNVTNFITSKSATIIQYKGNTPQDYPYVNRTTDNILYKSVNATGYGGLLLDFKWRCLGNSGTDYGKVCYSTNNGATWTNLSPEYAGQASTQTVTALELPAGLANTTFLLGFRFICDAAGTINTPGFIVDDISIKGFVAPNAPSTPTGAVTSRCTNNAITNTFTVSSVNGATGYVWAIAPGAAGTISGTTTTGTVTWAAGWTGTATITAAAENCGGTGAYSSGLSVTISAQPGVTTPTADQTVCANVAPSALSVTASGGSGTTSYQWYSNTSNSTTGGTTVGSNSSSFSPSASGTAGSTYYYCIVSNSGTNCVNATSPATATVTVNPIPVGTSSLSTQSICSGQTTTAVSLYTSNNVTGTTFTWTRNKTTEVTGIASSGSGASIAASTLTNTTLTSQTVVFTITPTGPASSNCPGSTYTVSIVVTPGATVNAGSNIAAGTASTPCKSVSPSAVNLTGASIGGSATDAAWSVTTGTGTLSSTVSSATPGSITYTPGSNESGTVTLTLTTNDPDGAGGCTAVSATKTIFIETPVTITTSTDFVNSSTTCGQTSLSLAHDGVAGSGVWEFSASVLPDAATDASITVTAGSGTYNTNITATWNATSQCADVTKTIRFNQPVTSSISADLTSNNSWLWGGISTTAWGTAANWYKWDGSKWLLQSSATPGSTDRVFMLNNSTAGVCVSASNAPALGSSPSIDDIKVGTGQTISLNSNSLTINGDLINDGTINAGTGTVVFNATSGNQTIGGTQPVTLNNLTLNKNAGNLVVSTPVTVNGTLTMTKGNISNTSLITLGSSSASTGTLSHTIGTITGAFRRYFANSTGTNYYFPIGNATYTRGVTVNMSQAPGADQYITAEYKSGTPQVNGSTLGAGLPLTTSDGQLIQNYDNEGYWQIDPKQYDSGIDTKNYTISLQMNTISGVNDYTKTRIIKADGPSHVAWSALTHVSATGSNTNFTLSGSGNGFSWFNGGGDNNNNPLPVELVSFSGLCEEGIINLTWQTASEFNSSHFDVEKSRDGENWQLLTTLPSAGTSNELITYQSTDKNGTEGNNYFRLRQVDIDGTEKLYDPINVSCSEVTTGYFSSFPNPSGNAFQVILNNKELVGACTMNIVDATGKVIEKREVDVKDGINMFVVSQELTPGIYFLNISNGSKSTPVLRHAIK